MPLLYACKKDSFSLDEANLVEVSQIFLSIFSLGRLGINVYIGIFNITKQLALKVLGPVAQWVASLTADPGVASLIPTWSLVEIDHEIISMVILLLQLIQERLLSFTSKIIYMKYWLTASSSLPRKKVVWLLTIST